MLYASRQTFVRSGEPIKLDLGAHLSIPVTLKAPGLSPGTYELRVAEFLLQCKTASNVVNQGGLFTFEVRAADRLPERLDRLFRQATSAIEHGDARGADPFIDRMLIEYPQSSAAYQLRGTQAEKNRRWREAADAYDLAAELLETGQDKLRRQDEFDTELDNLRMLAREARRKGAKR